MKHKDYNDFVFKSESMVSPEDVTAISFLGDFNKFLPKGVQQNIMEKGSQKIPYMGFIVEPYCFFLSYRLKNLEAAGKMLPHGYELDETCVFDGHEKYPMAIFCAFSVRSSAFIGRRLELYLIARNKKTGLLSWVIADYETNTNSHDPKNGFCGYTSEPSVLTTTPFGELLVDFRARKRPMEFSITADLQSGSLRKLDKDLWIEGNLSVDYGGELKCDASKPFSLIFNPVLMEKAMEIPLDMIEIRKNSYLKDLIDFDSPEESVVFPYSQHFIIKQDLVPGTIRDEGDLGNHVRGFLDREGYKTMKGDDIKKPLFRGMMISSLLNGALILFLLLKVFGVL